MENDYPLMRCPKCGKEQKVSEFCLTCGLIFSKYNNRRQEQKTTRRFSYNLGVYASKLGFRWVDDNKHYDKPDHNKNSYSCSVCNNIVSNDAVRCPSCGKKNPIYQEKIIKILKVLVILAVVISMFFYVKHDIKASDSKLFRDTLSSADPVKYGNACTALDDINMLRTLNREINKLESSDKDVEEKIIVARFYCRNALERAVNKQNN